MARLQSLPAGFSAMGRLSMQWANKNLDSSEKFSLGGAAGVRAYPIGEAIGDAGAVAQLELRYLIAPYPAFSPYLFVDAGAIQTNVNPPAGNAKNTRSLAGSGVGVRYERNALSADAALAWRNVGGVPQSDTSSEPKPRVWVHLGYRF